MSDERSPSASTALDPASTFLGHPRGLFVLFFVEMWERFSYYGMRALLVFYMTKGFLGFGDKLAYGVYGAYTALVYATPFIGGMLADRLLGQRRAVILGGMLMAAGHLLMTVERSTAFYAALALLICGNGFFKPNISTMVGSMYPAGSPKRDGGFTIFYMGINLGAAMSPLICGYVGETFGWHYGFGLATIGMLAGLITFSVSRTLSRILIGLTAITTVAGMVWLGRSDLLNLAVNAPVGIALLVGAFISIAALASGGLPEGLGAPKDASRMGMPAFEPIRTQPIPYYLAIIGGILLLQHVVVPQSEFAVILMLVGGFALLLPWLKAVHAVYLGTAAIVPVVAILVQNNEVAGLLLGVFGGGALLKLAADAFQAEKVERERLFVVLILMFFSMLFWAFFEQAGSSLNNFADRNVDRIVNGRVLTQADVGQPLTDVPITQAFCGRKIDGKEWTLTTVEAATKQAQDEAAQQASADKSNPGIPAVATGKPVVAMLKSVDVTAEMVGMKVYGTEIKASMFQAANPIYILSFGLFFTMAWGFLGARGLEPNTAIKFAFGLLQLGLGFGVVWFGAKNCSAHGFVAVSWLLLGYLLHTTGELCLSPVGLSMVTKLSPPRMVSTVMGAWFLATAFSSFLAGQIATLTGVGHGKEGGESVIPAPIDTVHVYGDVFGHIAIAAMISGVILLALSPLLVRWMHGADRAGGGH